MLSTKLCDFYRKPRDIVNSCIYLLEGAPCMDMNKVNIIQYLNKKDLLLSAEASILCKLSFNISIFNTKDYYSLFITMSYILNLSNTIIELAWTSFNQSFLCASINFEDYPDIVASAICTAFFLIKKHNTTPQDQVQENLEEKWYLSYNFDEDKVTKGFNEILKNIQEID